MIMMTEMPIAMKRFSIWIPTFVTKTIYRCVDINPTYPRQIVGSGPKGERREREFIRIPSRDQALSKVCHTDGEPRKPEAVTSRF
jgi:hypothetical protein